MRLSCRSDSPFYNPHITRGVHCFVDGELLAHCIEASEEEGWALCSLRTADDKPILHKGRMQTRRVVGKVEFRQKAPLDHKTQAAIDLMTDLIRRLRSGKETVEDCDVQAGLTNDNVMGDEWERTVCTGAYSYRIRTRKA